MAVQFNKGAGVYREETDLSEVVAPVGTSVGALVGASSKGITNSVTLVSTDKEFVDTFGEPNSVKYGYAGYAATYFLQESNNLYFVRSTSGDEAYANYTIGAAGEITYNTINANSSTVLLARAGYEEGNKADNIYELNAQAFSGSTSAGYFRVGAQGPGLYGQNIGIKVSVYSAVTSACEWVGSYPTSSIDQRVFKLDVYVKGDNDSAFPSDPAETFYCSRNSADKTSTNASLYIEDVINGNSKYIYVNDNTAISNTLSPGATVGSSGIVTLSGAADGVSEVNPANIQAAWALFANKETVNINILMVSQTLDNTSSNSTAIASLQQYVNTICGSSRLDCISVIQVDEQDDTDKVTVANRKISLSYPSYTALYAGWDKIYDIYNDKIIYVPKCIFGGMLMARTDRVANTWDAPAGVNRGILPVIGQYKSYSASDIGYLYDRNINTSKAIRGFGHVMFGQKTAQTKKSALDRINVRRLLLYIENTVEPSLLPFLFEANTDKTRTRATSIIDAFLSGVQAGGGLTAYEVVCDETNNTAQVIDNNQLNVDIYVQPSKTIEFIKLQIVVTRSGVSFEEVR